jgi:hypothetical protein
MYCAFKGDMSLSEKFSFGNLDDEDQKREF